MKIERVEIDCYRIEKRLKKHKSVRRLSGQVIEARHMVKHGEVISAVKEYIDGIHNYFVNRGYQVDEIPKDGVGTAIRIEWKRNKAKKLQGMTFDFTYFNEEAEISKEAFDQLRTQCKQT